MICHNPSHEFMIKFTITGMNSVLCIRHQIQPESNCLPPSSHATVALVDTAFLEGLCIVIYRAQCYLMSFLYQ